MERYTRIIANLCCSFCMQTQTIYPNSKWRTWIISASKFIPEIRRSNRKKRRETKYKQTNKIYMRERNIPSFFVWYFPFYCWQYFKISQFQTINRTGNETITLLGFIIQITFYVSFHCFYYGICLMLFGLPFRLINFPYMNNGRNII